MPEIACGDDAPLGEDVAVPDSVRAALEMLAFAPPSRSVQDVDDFLAGLRGERAAGNFESALAAAEVSI